VDEPVPSFLLLFAVKNKPVLVHNQTVTACIFNPGKPSYASAVVCVPLRENRKLESNTQKPSFLLLSAVKMDSLLCNK
jgi:hypothetical protein